MAPHDVRAVHAARADFAAQVRAYRDLVAAASKASGMSLARIDAALAAFEPGYFNSLLVALDARFPRRDGAGAIGEVGRLVAAITVHDGVLAGDAPGRFEAATGLLGLEPGDRVALNADDFEMLAAAYLAEREAGGA